MSFSNPAALALLAVLPLFWVVRARGRRGPGALDALGTARARSSPGYFRGGPAALVLRLTVVTLLVLALAGLHLPAPPSSVATVFAVDLSESIPLDLQDAARQWVRAALNERGPDDLAAIVTFARDAYVELPLGRYSDHERWGPPPPGGSTDLAAALRLAASLLPPRTAAIGRRIVLLTDGDETVGNALQALQRPDLRDVEVAVRPIDPQRQLDTAISSLQGPTALREGEPLEVRVGVYSPVNEDATLRLWANDRLISEDRVDLVAGPNEFAVERSDLPQGFYALRAVIEPRQDSRGQNNEGWWYTQVKQPAHVLLVEGTPGEASEVANSLLGASILVERASATALPAQTKPLERFDAILLANVPASQLRREQMAALQQYAAELGRGLVVLGGDQAYGLGDYGSTPLEAALPVSVQPPDREQSATLALLLVIDRSGSMATADTANRRQTRMDLAKEGAIQAVETLQDGDQVGVIAFDYSPQWVVGLRSVRSPADVRSVSDRIATIHADGGTDIFRALDEAYRTLAPTSARIKHIILLTDGESPQAAWPALMAAMRRAGITLSTVGVSSETGGQLLQNLARLGQGRHYFTRSPDEVPQIMTKEARLAGRSFRQDRTFRPRLIQAGPVLKSLVPAELPNLHGYVRVSPKPGAEVLLTSDLEETILAQWQYGLGRALAWTADAQQEWARDWVGTPEFDRVWRQAVRWTMAAPTERDLQVSTTSAGGELLIRVEAVEATGEFRNLMRTESGIFSLNGLARTLAVPQVAPGLYEVRVPAPPPGAYALQVTQWDASDPNGGNVVASVMTGFAIPYSPEHAPVLTNRALLQRLAGETGASMVGRPGDAFTRTTGVRRPQPVWQQLLMAAVLLFVVDVAVRRLRLGRAELRDLAADVGQGLRGLFTHLRPRRPQFGGLLGHLHPLRAHRQPAAGTTITTTFRQSR